MAEVGSNTTLGPDVRLADSACIGNNVILEGHVTIESGTRIDHGCIIRGTVTIGKNNWVYPYCVIGTDPQHREFVDKNALADLHSISIGDNNVIREFATVHRPIKYERTSIGSGCYIMAYAHIAHDCIISNNVVMATRVTLGGHIEIRQYANIGQGTKIHQYCKIGRHAMVGMGNSITKDVLPFSLINQQRFTKINRVGMERNGVASDDVDSIQNMYRDKFPIQDAHTWYEAELISFMKESTRKYYPPKFI